MPTALNAAMTLGRAVADLGPRLVTASSQAHQDVMDDLLDHVAAVSQVLLLSVLGGLSGSVKDSHSLEEVADSHLNRAPLLLV